MQRPLQILGDGLLRCPIVQTADLRQLFVGIDHRKVRHSGFVPCSFFLFTSPFRARLSNPEALCFDSVLEQPRASTGQRFGYCLPGGRRAVAEETAAAARAAHLRRRRPRRGRPFDQFVDGGGRDARREALSVVPFLRDLPTDLVPILLLKRLAQGGRRVADSLEGVEDVAVTIQVTLRDLPIDGA